jgi:hypothetical protein
VANPWANFSVARASSPPIWPASGRQVKAGALQRLSAKPGRQQSQVSPEAYEAIKLELQNKERALADLSVELAILRKKTNGGSWDR